MVGLEHLEDLIDVAVEDAVSLRQRLTEFLQLKELEAAFVWPEPQLRCNHAILNQLAKRGGDIARILEEERTSIRGDSTLELERKPEVGHDERHLD